VVTKSRVQLTAARAAEFYSEHDGKPFFEKLCAFMSSGPLVGDAESVLGDPTNIRRGR
jgi:nucleoside-diphosphate kinase